MAAVATSEGKQNPAASPDKGIDWWGMRSERSKAIPKHTLFGTSLENVDKEALKDTEGRYIPEGYIRPARDLYPLPEDIKQKIPGREALESSRKKVQEQQSIFCETDKELKQKTEKALVFLENKGAPVKTAGSESSRPSWLTQKDLEHSKEINIVGLNERGSFNRDKYGPKPRRHNYSLIGDVLAKNMDFNTTKQMDDAHIEALREQRAKAWGPGRHLPHDLMQDAASKVKKSSRSLVDLPANIRHTFGSKVCDSLLSDKNLVDRALERQQARSGPPRPSKKEEVKGLPVDLENTYESIGQATRYNVFPGLTTEHTISRTQNDFNEDVHKRRVPVTDEFRYQRDELSTWSEHNVLRDRMKKAWDEAYPLGGKKQ